MSNRKRQWAVGGGRWAVKPRPEASANGRPLFWRTLLLAGCTLVFALLVTGCRRDMQDQPRYEVYEKSDFFKDGISARPLVEGTVPRGYLREDQELYTGRKAGSSSSAANGTSGAAAVTQSGARTTTTTTTSDGAAPAPGAAGSAVQTYDANLVEQFPFPITQDVLNRGQERYQVFCSMCHGATGYGNGMIVKRGYRQPPSYHTDQLRAAPVGHFFDVITNGWGVMPNYAAQVPVRDRWAIVAYIRALQLSREGTAADMPPPQQQQAAGQNHAQVTEKSGREK